MRRRRNIACTTRTKQVRDEIAARSQLSKEEAMEKAILFAYQSQNFWNKLSRKQKRQSQRGNRKRPPSMKDLFQGGFVR